jgi:hypothetical protein
VHDEGSLLHILPNAEEGKESNPAVNRLQSVHEGNLQKK